MKRNYITRLSSHDIKIIENLKDAPRIVGYSNYLDWFEVRKYRGKFNLFASLNPEKLMLKDLGYDDKWSKDKKLIEQFNVIFSEEQIKKLRDVLNKKLGKGAD